MLPTVEARTTNFGFAYDRRSSLSGKRRTQMSAAAQFVVQVGP